MLHHLCAEIQIQFVPQDLYNRLAGHLTTKLRKDAQLLGGGVLYWVNTVQFEFRRSAMEIAGSTDE